MIGTIIGTYRILEKLGDGGLGAVYRAADQTTGREAAFRMFSQDVSRDPMLAERLRAMAPALKKLQHPNIAGVYELITVGPDLSLFMEYVAGTTLDQVQRQTGRLEVNVAVSCAVQLLRALEFAHANGVLHHALRPTNVMVTPEGTAKVMDFGIGHAFGANRKTREDRLLHVLAYLAPEQIQNQPGDARADIYAVGVMLYEWLTGRPPFDHKTEFALRQAHLNEPLVAPRAFVPGLPEWLDQAVVRALAKNPASRYQNATECRAVLEAALGLSTSRAAAVVRDASGNTTVAMYSAAPPLPEASSAAGPPPAPPQVPPAAPAPPPPVASAPAPPPPPPVPTPVIEDTVVMRAPASAPPPAPPEPPAPATPAAPPTFAKSAAAAPVSPEVTAVLTPRQVSELPTSPMSAPAPAALAPREAVEPPLPPPAPSPAPPPVLVSPEQTIATAGVAALAVAPASPAAKPTAGKPPAAAGTSSGKIKPAHLALALVLIVVLLGGAAAGGFFWWRSRAAADASIAAAADGTTAAPPGAAPGAATGTTGAPDTPAPPAAATAAPEPPAPPAAATAAPEPPVSTVPPPSSAPASSAAQAPQAAPKTPAPLPLRPAKPSTPATSAEPAPATRPPTQVAPPSEPAPAAAPPAHRPADAPSLPEVSFRKVKLLSLNTASDQSTDVVLMFLTTRVTVTPTAGGTALRSVRYRDMKQLSYAKEEKKRLGLIKTAQHVLTIETEGAPLLLRLDKENVDAILAAFEARGGKTVKR